jgi:hypothetical protein
MLTRRRVLVSLAVVSANSLLAATLAARAIPLHGRPAPAGTSATRCAQCGASDHNMLDRRCPAAPRVMA